MTTRAETLAAVLATAQALGACADCPTLPDQHVVSKGEPFEECRHCGARVIGDPGECDGCGRGGESWHTGLTWPDAVRIPDLTSDANGGVLQGLLAKRCRLLAVGYVEPHKSHDNGGWHVTADQQKTQRAEHYGHAMALAWLAATPSTSTGETP